MPQDELSEAQRVLELLIHDLRTPLSVAQGYVRLLQENRLHADDERQQAFTGTMKALGHIARLCDDAASYTAAPTAVPPPGATVRTETVVEQVERACAKTPPSTLSFVVPAVLKGTLRVGAPEDVVHAVTEILCAVHRAARLQPRTVVITETDEEALFLLSSDGNHASLQAGPVQPFDPWHGGHGVALPLACRTVARTGGRVWTTAEVHGCVGIAFPARIVPS